MGQFWVKTIGLSGSVLGDRQQFVAAGVEHRFSKFSEDFSTWVFFYGPQGGEVP